MIAVLTYNSPHRKTQDLLMRLAAYGFKEVVVVATPWENRKNFKPLIPHRPSEPNWPCEALNIQPNILCLNLEYEYRVEPKSGLSLLFAKLKPEMVLIGGAGILPPAVVNSAMLVNSHPAWLPMVRGLDALKWAIYYDLTVGVTLHVIDEHPDAGFLITRMEVPLYPSDTFHSFAIRQYDMEIELLAGAPYVLPGKLKEMERLSPNAEAYEVHHRMPHIKEMVMLKRFEQRRDLAS